MRPNEIQENDARRLDEIVEMMHSRYQEELEREFEEWYDETIGYWDEEPRYEEARQEEQDAAEEFEE